MTSSPGVSAPRVQPAALQNAPVGATEVSVAQSVAHRVHRTVDVAQPVTCNPQRNRQMYAKLLITSPSQPRI